MVTLNPDLIKRQGLNEDDVSKLQDLHSAREKLFEYMEDCDPNVQEDIERLHAYVEMLEAIEFEMQRTWKFPEDSSKHRWWYKAPHCTCPKMDNEDYLGFNRIINANCPLHGDKHGN